MVFEAIREAFAEAVRLGKEAADSQSKFDLARTEIINLSTPPETGLDEIGLGDFLSAVNFPHTVFALCPPQVAKLQTSQGTYDRYSDANSPPADVNLVEWNLRQADVQLENMAKAQGARYAPVLARQK